MAKITFKGNEVNTNGSLPAVGAEAPDFKGVKSDLSELHLKDLKGKKVVINVFPSLDTAVCAASVRRFNKEAASLPNTVVLAVSKDLPFAQGRFCTTEGIDKVIPLSAFRCSCFENGYGMLMVDGPLKGLLARGVIVVDEAGKVVYEELVSEITNEPNYEAAIASFVISETSSSLIWQLSYGLVLKQNRRRYWFGLLSWLCIPNLYPLTTPFNRRFEENRIYVPVSKILKWFTD